MDCRFKSVWLALLWWDSNEEDIHTWNEFVRAFSLQFVSGDNTDHLWHELKTLRQDGKSVEELGYRLVELFGLLGIKDEEARKRYLESALHPDLALALESKDDLDDFKTCLTYARKMERLKKKYGNCLSAGSVASSVSSTSTMGQLARDFRSLNVNMVKPGSGPVLQERPQQDRAPTNLKNNGGGRPCFICDELGHFATACPWKDRIKQLKSEGNGSGKGLDRQ